MTTLEERIGSPQSRRWLYLDNLKTALIAAVIVLHGLLGYVATLEVWSYSGVREATLDPVVETALLVPITPFGLFLMPLMFLVAGLLTPGSLVRKGPGRFAGDRLVRLGIPFAVYVLLVQPVVMYAIDHPYGDASGTFWEEYLGAEHQLDTGPLWFVGVLLIFSLLYAGWVAVGGRSHPVPGRVVGLRQLLVLAALVAVASFLVRTVYPFGGESGFFDLNYWEWPACLAVFALGIVGVGQGWMDQVPERLWRRCRAVTLLCALGLAGVLVVAGLRDQVEWAVGGRHWLQVGFTLTEVPLAICGPVWLLAAARRYLERPFRWGAVLSRTSYAAFMLQTIVLIGLAVALRPLDLPAEVKAVAVAAGGLAGSFGLGWLLLQVPGVRRVL